MAALLLCQNKKGPVASLPCLLPSLALQFPLQLVLRFLQSLCQVLDKIISVFYANTSEYQQEKLKMTSEALNSYCKCLRSMSITQSDLIMVHYAPVDSPWLSSKLVPHPCNQHYSRKTKGTKVSNNFHHY